MRFKIFGQGQSDWKGLILGARALDTQARGSPGFRVTDNQYALESEGMVQRRLGEDMMPRKDDVYLVDAYAIHDDLRQQFDLAQARSVIVEAVRGRPALAAAGGNKSVFDPEDEDDVEEARGFQMGAFRACESGDQDAIEHDGEGFDLEPGESAWIPVRRNEKSAAEERRNPLEIILQPERACTDVAPGMWEPGPTEGLVFVANTTEFDQRVEKGATVDVVAEAAVQTRVCQACGAEDMDAWPAKPGDQRCEGCHGLHEGGSTSCR